MKFSILQLAQRSGGFVVGFGTACILGTLILGASQVLAGPDHGTVAPWDAMKSAVAHTPGGRAYSATYAKEGNHWLYDVIVIKQNALTEVEVDATTGKVGDSEAATPEGEGKELTAELNKVTGHASSKTPAKEGKEEKEKGEKSE